MLLMSPVNWNGVNVGFFCCGRFLLLFVLGVQEQTEERDKLEPGTVSALSGDAWVSALTYHLNVIMNFVS